MVTALSFDCLCLSFWFCSVNLTCQRVGWNIFFLIFASVIKYTFLFSVQYFFFWAVCSDEKSFLRESCVLCCYLYENYICDIPHFENIVTHPSVVWWIFMTLQFFWVISPEYIVHICCVFLIN